MDARHRLETEHAVSEQEQYHGTDLPYHHGAVKPLLPPRILDFHAYI